MIPRITALLAGHLAAGGLFLTAALALANRLPPAFLRFCTLSAAILGGVAASLDTSALRYGWTLVALAAASWHLRLRFAPEGRSRGPAAAAGLVALAAPAWFAWQASSLGLAVAGSVSSALLLGAVTVTMILGHWYLVDTSLSIAPLKDGARWLWIAVFGRFGVVGLVLAYGGFEVLRVGRAADLIFSTNGLFFLFRSLMGLAAPLLLAALIWQTVKIRSTQSATGLLYVALILVLFGELVSHFLFILTGYPL